MIIMIYLIICNCILSDVIPIQHDATPYHIFKTVEVMKILIDAGANVNAQNQIAKMTPLQCAIRGTFQSFQQTHTRRLQCVALLLEGGADGKICDLRGRDAYDTIDDAIQETKDRNMGVNIEAEMDEMRKALERGGLGMSPLAQLIEDLDVDGVREYLDDEDSKIENEEAVSQTEKNKCLLAVAEKFKSFTEEAEKFKLFIDEKSITDIAAYNSLKDICHFMLEAGANPNYHLVADTPDPLEGAPLHIIAQAICEASPTAPTEIAAAMIQDLLSHDAKMASVTMELLPKAAHRGKLHAVKFLIEQGVDPNMRGRQGMTSLIFASRTGKVDIVKYLLENDSLDLSSTDNVGKKAIDYATANDKEEIVALLLERS